MSIIRIQNKVFGKNHIQFGSENCKDGISLLFWRKYINDVISDKSAGSYLSGKYVALDLVPLQTFMNTTQKALDDFMIWRYSLDGMIWQATCDAIRAAMPIYGAAPTPFPPLPPGIRVVSNQELDYIVGVAIRVKAEQSKLAKSDAACALVLGSLKESICPGLKDKPFLSTLFSSHRSNHLQVDEAFDHISIQHLGVPSDDRMLLYNTLYKHPKATRILDVGIAGDNLMYLSNLMTDHYNLVIKIGKTCDTPVTDIELGSLFHKLIDWDVPLFGGLNALLYPKRMDGLVTLVGLAKEWCETHEIVNPINRSILTSTGPNVTPSPLYQADALVNITSQQPNKKSDAETTCSRWDGSQCSFEASTGFECKYNHIRGKDTRSRINAYRETISSRDDNRLGNRDRDRSSSRENGRNRSHHSSLYSEGSRENSRDRDSRRSHNSRRDTSSPTRHDRDRSRDRSRDHDGYHHRDNNRDKIDPHDYKPASSSQSKTLQFDKSKKDRSTRSHSSDSDRSYAKRPGSPTQSSLNYRN